jgi:hypothetical protein
MGFWSAAFLMFVWSLSRWASSHGYRLTSARGLTLLLLICTLLAPIPFLDAIADIQGSDSIWSLYPLFAVVDHGSVVTAGFVLLGSGIVIAAAAHWNDKRREARLRL